MNVAPEILPNIISRIVQSKHSILCSWGCLGRKGHKLERLPHSAPPCTRGVNKHYCVVQRSYIRDETAERCRL